MNLGISESFGFVDFENLPFPTSMRIDYVRVYQRPDSKNVGCDPPDFPTSAYINQSVFSPFATCSVIYYSCRMHLNRYIDAYTNPNLTTWKDDYGEPFPKNNLVDEC